MGSHSELMTLKGAYFKMVNAQERTDTINTDGKVPEKQFILYPLQCFIEDRNFVHTKSFLPCISESNKQADTVEQEDVCIFV